MSKTKYTFYILLLSLLAGCYKEIDIELEEGDRRVIVEAWFTTEAKTHEIKISQSTSYFDDETPPLVSGADVQITGGGETFIFNEVSPGIYHSAPTAQAKLKTDYTLSIQYDGITYEATDHCDTVPNLDQLELVPRYNSSSVLVGYDILIWTQELTGFGHYYAWRVFVNNTIVSDTLSDLTFESDDYLGDGLYFPAWPIEYAKGVQTGDVVKLEQHNISKQTFDAWIAIMSETDWRGGIFDAPPANVPTNFNNGAMGLFVVSSMVSAEAIVP